MSLTIYNTMTRNKEVLVPITPNHINMYVCGPTVYDYLHIGNARPLIFFDVVRAYLAYSGYKVRYIVNFTDVDDKLIRKAEELGITVPQLADQFIEAYYVDTKGLRIKPADVHPRVTENMPEIIEFVGNLVEADLAYEKGGDVYFRTNKFPAYGKLSHQNMHELQFGIRIDVDERKENPQDFVLWKKAKPGEIFWDSPWGEGRPGWHIECSAMAMKYLGETLDIHSGGHDLQFPHHECEVAQSESLTGKPLANYWMHNGFININNEKMSKSLGNGINVRELLKGIRPEVIRYIMLSTHYRSPLNFSNDAIEQAQHALERVENCVANLKHRMQVMSSETSGTFGSNVANGSSPRKDSVGGMGRILDSDIRFAGSQLSNEIKSIFDEYQSKMDDDFNTPDAITAVFDLVSAANSYIIQPIVDPTTLLHLLSAFEELNDVLRIIAPQGEELIEEDIERLILERIEARKSKMWSRADEIRDLLHSKGIVLEDTPQGIRWRRK